MTITIYLKQTVYWRGLWEEVLTPPDLVVASNVPSRSGSWSPSSVSPSAAAWCRSPPHAAWHRRDALVAFQDSGYCWTSNVLHVQNWRKAIYKKYWNVLIRNYSAGLFSGTSLTKKQPRNTFLQSLYSMHRRVSASHWLGIRPGLLQSAPTFLSFCPDAVSAFLQK